MYTKVFRNYVLIFLLFIGEEDQRPKFVAASGGRIRTLSLGSIFSRRRSKTLPTKNYMTDFWARNFSEKSTVSWNEFRAAFVLDYKNELEEFSDTGHLNCVLTAAHDKLCNKESVVYIGRYRTFIGSDSSPNAIWNKIKQEATKRVFEEAVRDSLCL